MYSVTIVWSAFAFIHLRLVPTPRTPHTQPPPSPPQYCGSPFGAVECPTILRHIRTHKHTLPLDFQAPPQPTSPLTPLPPPFFIAHLV